MSTFINMTTGFFNTNPAASIPTAEPLTPTPSRTLPWVTSGPRRWIECRNNAEHLFEPASVRNAVNLWPAVRSENSTTFAEDVENNNSTDMDHSSNNSEDDSDYDPDKENRAPRPEITLGMRRRIRTLRHDAEWTLRRIANHVNVSYPTVYRITKAPPGETPTKPRTGRPKFIDTPTRKQLVTLATKDAEHRRTPWAAIAYKLGLKVRDHKAIRAAFSAEGYGRRIARAKPFLTAEHRQNRLEFALRFCDWTVQDWMQVIWTDECCVNLGGRHGKTYVTRRPGEEFEEACLVPKFSSYDTQMIWGCFKGNVKGPLYFWNKGEGNITAQRYIDKVIRPLAHPFWRTCSTSGDPQYVYFMHDNASPHRAAKTTAVLYELQMGEYLIRWPACSPDLNPIETVWNRMKDRLFRRCPRPTKRVDLNIAIQEEWDAITPQELYEMVATMPERIQAVIAAEGGHTRF